MASTDLCQAVVAQLKATSAVTSAFGDTWDDTSQTGVSKIFFDFAGQAIEPYLVAFELWETYEFMTRTTGLTIANYIATGQIAIRIWQSDRQAARVLGFLVAAALNDHEAAITWTGGTLMNFRIARAEFIPIGTPGPGVPVVFSRVLTFDYSYESQLTEP